ncbi:MAG: single-stranded DNA-binding protein [Propionibacteriaceae bacterium]|jgi:single-strand DNA-binding protein|nr:single-stranded DNA-binding protein [Propionibacteriaceae bacterium]
MDITMTLTGYVGGDVDTRTTRVGVPVATFRVATTPSLRRDNTWVDGATTWTTVTCFRSLAENVARSIKKGDPVIVGGRLRTQSWVDAAGENHERLVLEASQVGHDLSRGTSSFQRSGRRPAEEATLEADERESSGSDCAADVEAAELAA